MKNVQRSSHCVRVKSQANGERKIRLLIENKDEQMIYSRSERKWLLYSVYRVASISKYKAIYIVIPSFQVSSETSINLSAEATIDYAGVTNNYKQVIKLGKLLTAPHVCNEHGSHLYRMVKSL